MRSIERSYKKVQTRNPILGTYPCLAQVVKGKKYSRKSLVKAFTELMPKDELINRVVPFEDAVLPTDILDPSDKLKCLK